MSGRIFVCTTCDRYATAPTTPTPGQVLVAIMKASVPRDGQGITVRVVECLNNCHHPCAAALRAPGKAVIRFAGLKPEDVPALLDAATLYDASIDGNILDEQIPAALKRKVSGSISAKLA
jgi:predicted metal-binding protein